MRDKYDWNRTVVVLLRMGREDRNGGAKERQDPSRGPASGMAALMITPAAHLWYYLHCSDSLSQRLPALMVKRES
jgi:hypothetical protein